METRANHFVVGLFVLLSLLAGGGFIVWAARLGFDKEPAAYTIYFEGSVTGLGVASPVRYSGVRVGEVSRIRINPDFTQEIEVTVELDPETPVKIDSIASLEVAGIAGGTYVQLSGGSVGSPLLKPLYSGQTPVVHSRPSTLARLLEDVPQILGKIEEAANNVANLTRNINDQVSGERLARIDRILENIETATENFAESGDSIDATLEAVRSIATDGKALVARVDETLSNLDARTGSVIDNANGLIENADGMITDARGKVNDFGGEVDPLLKDWRQTTADARAMMARINNTSAQLQGFLGKNDEAVQEFATTGLAELTLLFAELRDLAANLNRVVEGIERDPGQVIFGTTRHGVEVK
ncbi:MAG: MlaD family protein [Alphaproteobacteria bacterium]